MSQEVDPVLAEALRLLQEGAAAQYGSDAIAGVVNIILKDNFASKTAEVEAGGPTRGGFRTYQLEATALRIKGPQRFSITGKLDKTSELTEAERKVVQAAGSVPTVASDPDPAAYRSLIPDSRELSLNLSLARGLGKDGLGGNVSVNGNLTRTDSHRNSGLDLVTLRAPDGTTALRTLADQPLADALRAAMQGGNKKG